jgi:hypothetical protein
MNDFHYTDPRGKRSGPFTEAELKFLASRGLLEPDGRVEVAGTGSSWKVSDVAWLASPSPLPPPAPDAAGSVTANTPPVVPPAPRSSEPTSAQSDTSRATYVLLALLPSCIGIFGVHNIVAGYTTRGIVQLLLSFAVFSGTCCCCFAPPCACFGVPLWIVLFTMSAYEALTVRTDARGRMLR